jgi:hypothetical protein
MLITERGLWSSKWGIVFLRISPMRGVMRFGKKGKLSPRIVGPFEITQRVGKLAYRIALPPDLVRTHDVYHVSMLRKYIANLDVIVEYEPLKIYEGLTYVEEPVKVVDKNEQVLHRRHHGKQNTTCGAAIRICLNDCV